MSNIDSIVDGSYMQSVDERLKSADAYLEYQIHEARRAVSFLQRFFLIQGARVLEVGAGRGGKGIAYAQAGMQVTSFDVDEGSLKLAMDAVKATHVDVCLLAADGAKLPFVDEHFDAVFIDSVIEHVADSQGVLEECQRVLKRSGILFVSFPPFYGPLSGHIDDFIMVPWFHLLPPSIVKRSLMRCGQSKGFLTPATAFSVFSSLNRMSILRFKREAKRAGLRFDYLLVRPFLTHPGNRFAVGAVSALRQPPRLKNLGNVIARARAEFSIATFLLFLLLAALTPLVVVPFAQEIAAGGVKAVLRKV